MSRTKLDAASQAANPGNGGRRTEGEGEIGHVVQPGVEASAVGERHFRHHDPARREPGQKPVVHKFRDSLAKHRPATRTTVQELVVRDLLNTVVTHGVLLTGPLPA